MSLARIKSLALLALGVCGLALVYLATTKFDKAIGSALEASAAAGHEGSSSLIELVKGRPNTIRLTDDGMKTVGLTTVEVHPAPPPEPLRLPGSLLLDPNQLVRIHARFPGELVSVGELEVPSAAGEQPASPPGRPLRFGDRVSKGQIIAVVWSKDIGEKKSELVDAISKSAIDQTLLARLEKVERGVVSERVIQDARRNYEADLINVAKAERTLRSWRLTDTELGEIHKEAQRIARGEKDDPAADRTWAETDVRSPIDGVIVEKNFNVGDIIDTSQDLFKIADLSRLLVLANAYEEDLPVLRQLSPEERTWKIDIKSDPNDVPVSGRIDTIGSIIDPTQHSGAVMGWLENPDGRFNVGEFITATIELPADRSLVSVPTSALIEDGTCPKVFVATGEDGTHEFTCQPVAVVRRGRRHVYVRSEPKTNEVECGATALRPGQLVVESGVLELNAELKSRQAAEREASR